MSEVDDIKKRHGLSKRLIYAIGKLPHCQEAIPVAGGKAHVFHANHGQQ